MPPVDPRAADPPRSGRPVPPLQGDPVRWPARRSGSARRRTPVCRCSSPAPPRHAVLVARADGYWLTPQRAAPVPVPQRPAARRAGAVARATSIELVPGVAYRAAARQTAAAPARPRPSRWRSPPAPAGGAPVARVPWWRRWGAGGGGRATGRGGRRVRGGSASCSPCWRRGWWSARRVALVRAWRPAGGNGRVAAHRRRGGGLRRAHRPGGRSRRARRRAARARAPRRGGARVRRRRLRWSRACCATTRGCGRASWRSRRGSPPCTASGGSPRRPATPARSAPPARARPRRSLTPETFATRLVEVQERFAARFGRPLVVTGRDHAEHVALYGPGGAVDLRVRDLTPTRSRSPSASSTRRGCA